jgi:hypothetical protein
MTQGAALSDLTFSLDLGEVLALEVLALQKG